MTTQSAAADKANWLLYDGDCPFCASYVRYVRLRDTAGPVTLADARQYPSLVLEANALGFDVDQGMVLKLDGRYYFGGDCIHTLALLTTKSGAFNRLNRALFKSRTLARFAYPLLRAGRNFALLLLGRKRLHSATVRIPEKS